MARRLSDKQLALVLSVVLFALVAWPLLVMRIPPYQDLPGHLAAVTILANPDHYPELQATGFMKPNSFFFLWTLTVGKAFGGGAGAFVSAAKIFTALVLAATAFALPRFVLHFSSETDRRARMIFAAPLLLPMVHNWFVSMGMLSFAASFPFALLLLIELDKGRMVRAAALALLAWYLHPFPILIVGLLAFASIVSEIVIEKRDRPLKERFSRVRLLLAPLLPAVILAFYIFAQHAAVTGAKMDPPEYSTPAWSLYNLWGQFIYGFTEVTAITIAPALVVGVIALVRFRAPEARTVTSALPFLALIAMYMFGPYVAFDANYIAPRLVPFFWMLALVRLRSPVLTTTPKQQRALSVVFYVSAIVYAIGMPYDLLRLSREFDDYEAGTSVMPDGAKLIQLSFNSRPTSKNTFNLGTAWGLYVLDRRASAIDAWANVPSMPIVLRTPLPHQLEPMMRARFIHNARSKEGYCESRRWHGFYSGDCDWMWAEEWRGFWRDVLPRFDFILLWDPPPDVIATIPPNFRQVLLQGRLRVYERVNE